MKLWHIFILLLFVFGCGRKNDTVKITTQQPLHENIITLADRSERIFSESNDAKLYRPVDFLIDNKFNCYFLDKGLGCIKVFDKNFNFLRAIGQLGSGPGEFSDGVKSIRLMNDSILIVFDNELKRFSFFTREGKYIKGKKFIEHYVDDFIFEEKQIIISNFAVDDGIYAVKILDTNFVETMQFGKIIPIKSGIFDKLTKSSYKSIITEMFSNYNYTRIVKLDNKIFYAQKNPYGILMYDENGNFIKGFNTSTDFSTEFNIEIKEEDNAMIRKVISPPGSYYNINIYKEKYILALVPKPAKSFRGDTSRVDCWLDCYNLEGRLLDRIDIDLNSTFPMGLILSYIQGDFLFVFLNDAVQFPKMLKYRILIKE